jgi:hypothetical protein
VLVAEQGVSGSIARATLTSFDGNLTVANVDGLLKSLYETSLKFYETFPHCWFQPAKFVPIFQAEKLYQNLLYLYLKASTQGTWVVVREDQTNAGRTDLSLTALNPELIFVLEMKVLKSFFYHAQGAPVKKFSNRENEDWAASGIPQVCDYRTAKQAKEAFLLLYDMRKKHKPMAKVQAKCTENSVELRKYDIFNATARDVRAPKPKRSKTR